MSKSPLPHLDKPDEETIDKMKSSDYSKNQKVQDEILKFLENDKQLIKAIRKEWFCDFQHCFVCYFCYHCSYFANSIHIQIAITITAIITVISCMKKRVLKNIKSLFFCFLVLP